MFPYLEKLMSHLLSLLDNGEGTELAMKLKELSFSCIASIGMYVWLRLVTNTFTNVCTETDVCLQRV